MANLAAANKYKHEHILTPELQAVLDNVAIAYSSGFFLTVSPQTAEYIAQRQAAAKKIYACNLSAPFVVQFFGEPLSKVLAYSDFVFGNDDEAVAWATANGVEDKTPAGAAKALSLLEKKGNPDRHRVAVITQGSKPTLVAVDGEVCLALNSCPSHSHLMYNIHRSLSTR